MSFMHLRLELPEFATTENSTEPPIDDINNNNNTSSSSDSGDNKSDNHNTNSNVSPILNTAFRRTSQDGTMSANITNSIETPTYGNATPSSESRHIPSMNLETNIGAWGGTWVLPSPGTGVGGRDNPFDSASEEGDNDADERAEALNALGDIDLRFSTINSQEEQHRLSGGSTQEVNGGGGSNGNPFFDLSGGDEKLENDRYKRRTLENGRMSEGHQFGSDIFDDNFDATRKVVGNEKQPGRIGVVSWGRLDSPGITPATPSSTTASSAGIQNNWPFSPEASAASAGSSFFDAAASTGEYGGKMILSPTDFLSSSLVDSAESLRDSRNSFGDSTRTSWDASTKFGDSNNSPGDTGKSARIQQLCPSDGTRHPATTLDDPMMWDLYLSSSATDPVELPTEWPLPRLPIPPPLATPALATARETVKPLPPLPSTRPNDLSRFWEDLDAGKGHHPTPGLARTTPFPFEKSSLSRIAKEQAAAVPFASTFGGTSTHHLRTLAGEGVAHSNAGLASPPRDKGAGEASTAETGLFNPFASPDGAAIAVPSALGRTVSCNIGGKVLGGGET